MKFKTQTLRPLFFLFLLICLLSGMVGGLRIPVSAASSSIVISQVYGGGGNAGATYKNDFVELFNLSTTTTVSLTGWSIQYATANGTTWTPTNLSGSLAAGQYYLIQLGPTGATGLPLPPPVDATGTVNIAAGAGKIALVNTITPLAGTCPTGGGIVDFIGYGATANCFETAVAPAPSAVLSDLRASNGCTDVDNNASDFVTSAPTPRNTNSLGLICGVGTYTPTSTPTNTAIPTNTSTPTSTFTPSATPIFSLTPSLTPVPGEVIISEVAWSGTQASIDDEWIELYNTRSTSINLTGWRLVSNSIGGVDILLNGTIPGNGFFLLERGSNNTVSDVVADQLYTGILPDTGDVLRLRMPNGTVIDTANSNGGAWPAGTGSPNFNSMERVVTAGIPAADSDSGWVSNINVASWTKHDAANNLIHGTPSGINWGFAVTATTAPSATFTPTNTATPTRTSTSSPTISPTPAGFLSVIINEVAWMGTGSSASDEWIELYNPSTTVTVNLAGWILKADDTSPNITFPAGKTIPPQGYFLLERTDDNTVIDVTADLIYTGELSNSFEVLRLFDSSNRLIDTANSNSGNWPAGFTSSTTHGTMERRGVVADGDAAWITNVNPASWTKHDARGITSTNYLIHGTPKYANWALSVTATPSPVPSNTSVPTKFKTTTPVPVYVPPPPLIGINEFVPRPGHDWNNDGVVNVGDEYIELLNHGTIAVDLSGYSLDDEANIGSQPYRLPSVTLKPGERIVFYGKDTGLLLSDGGDGVRLIKPNGQLGDAYNYTVVKYPDQAYCRLPDNGGLDDWNTNCFPTPGLKNSLSGNFSKPPGTGIADESSCPISDTLPVAFAWAECPSFGNIWSRFYWDAKGWFGEKTISDNNSKWDVYVD